MRGMWGIMKEFALLERQFPLPWGRIHDRCSRLNAPTKQHIITITITFYVETCTTSKSRVHRYPNTRIRFAPNCKRPTPLPSQSRWHIPILQEGWYPRYFTLDIRYRQTTRIGMVSHDFYCSYTTQPI